MPRKESRLIFSKEEIKEMLERKHNIRLATISFKGDDCIAELENEN